MRKYNNKSNISGKIIEQYRLKADMSREALAEQLQLLGLSIDRYTSYRKKVIIKDFELLAICKILNIDYYELQNKL